MKDDYDFSINMSVTELQSMLDYANRNKLTTIGVHINRGAILDGKYVSKTMEGWKDLVNHENVTDYDSA